MFKTPVYTLSPGESRAARIDSYIQKERDDHKNGFLDLASLFPGARHFKSKYVAT